MTMGFLDKLLGRRKDDDAEMQTTPQPTSTPTDEPHEHSPDEGEHSHGEGEHSH
jgi:hypothetical protein